MDARALVAAMLGPHDRENAEFDEVGLAAEGVEDAVIFFRSEAMLGDDFGRNRGGEDNGHAAPLAAVTSRG